MGMEFGSTKRNRCTRSGLLVDNPLVLFGTVKTVPVCMKWTINVRVFWHENCLM